MSFLPSWLKPKQIKKTQQNKLQFLTYQEIIGQNEKNPKPTQHPAKSEAQLGITEQNTVQQAPDVSKNLVFPMISLSCAKLTWSDITRCGGLTLAEHQVPTKPLNHSCSSAGHGEKNGSKSLWAEIRTG